ncbi:MAG: hypothetical protein ABW179_11785, partial [Methylobacterium sp.]
MTSITATRENKVPFPFMPHTRRLLLLLLCLLGLFVGVRPSFALSPVSIGREDVAIDLLPAVDLYSNRGANFQVS